MPWANGLGPEERGGWREESPPHQRGLCPQIEDFDGEGIAALEAVGLIEEGGGAGAAGEGDHQHAGGGGAGMGGGLLAGAAEHLAIAHRAGGDAVAGPLGGHGFYGPAEAMGGGIDGAIGTTGAAMEHQLHEATGGSGAEGGGDHQGRPIEITTTAGHHHQGAAVGAGNGERSRWSGERAMRRQGERRCGARKEQTHGGLEE